MTGGLTTIASVLSNWSPIDQRCVKKPVMNFHFSPMYDVLKYPVMQKEDIEAKCADTIPADDTGRRTAEKVKLMKAKNNTTGPEHPCSKEQTKIAIMHIADELGTYWKTKLAPSYQPLTIEDAIWGNKFTPPMDLDTSTGVSFQMLCPGSSKKKQLVGEHGVFIGDAAAWLKAALIRQLDHWKRGEVWIMPGSYSLKAECLPIEKVWKKQIVNVCDPVTTINSRRLMMPIQTAFTCLGAKSPYQVVLNPYTKMNGLAEMVLKVEAHYDVGVSGFDLTVPKLIVDCVAACNKRFTGAGNVLSNMFDKFFLTVSSSPVVAGKTFYVDTVVCRRESIAQA